MTQKLIQTDTRRGFIIVISIYFCLFASRHVKNKYYIKVSIGSRNHENQPRPTTLPALPGAYGKACGCEQGIFGGDVMNELEIRNGKYKTDNFSSIRFSICKYTFAFAIYQWPWIPRWGFYNTAIGQIIDDTGIFQWLINVANKHRDGNRIVHLRIACVAVGATWKEKA
jgi:hypothetical protein